eukprot:SAG11_NODE_660_length_7893_cov_4.055042_3_plen_85_part_00
MCDLRTDYKAQGYACLKGTLVSRVRLAQGYSAGNSANLLVASPTVGLDLAPLETPRGATRLRRKCFVIICSGSTLVVSVHTTKL